ncbi:putative endonuclease containing a URI domain [Gynuella sunshinyii YC6258]|uniref:Putative endonuclease containing a URI domain n=2 Tax=Gynuella sunshinyii TaxID=1445505 RepID=A0A0C5VCS1_9GAMM|nr:putative endonuclease containing a URI domain [Gynuella sunshinyii YC6258]
MLRCCDGSLYTGITTNLDRRLKEHNGDLSGGARFTRARRPVEVVYQERQPDRSQASRRERVIKKMERRQKLALIYSFPQQSTLESDYE